MAIIGAPRVGIRGATYTGLHTTALCSNHEEKTETKAKGNKSNRTDHQEDETKNKAKSPGTSQEAEECGESEAKLAKTVTVSIVKLSTTPPRKTPAKTPAQPAQTTAKARKERVNNRKGRGSETEAQPGRRCDGYRSVESPGRCQTLQTNRCHSRPRNDKRSYWDEPVRIEKRQPRETPKKKTSRRRQQRPKTTDTKQNRAV